MDWTGASFFLSSQPSDRPLEEPNVDGADSENAINRLSPQEEHDEISSVLFEALGDHRTTTDRSSAFGARDMKTFAGETSNLLNISDHLLHSNSYLSFQSQAQAQDPISFPSDKSIPASQLLFKNERANSLLQTAQPKFPDQSSVSFTKNDPFGNSSSFVTASGHSAAPPQSAFVWPHTSQHSHTTTSVTGTFDDHATQINSVDQRKANEVFIGDLSFFCEERDLFEFFSQCGRVDHCRVVRNNDRTRSLMFGFVTMGSPVEAEIAARTLHGQLFMGRKIKVELSERKGNEPTKHIPTYLNGFQIHLSFASTFLMEQLMRPTESFLRKFFSQFGEIVDVLVREYTIHQYQNMQEGYGFITFEREDSAAQAAHACSSVIVEGVVLTATLSYRNKPSTRPQQHHQVLHSVHSFPSQSFPAQFDRQDAFVSIGQERERFNVARQSHSQSSPWLPYPSRAADPSPVNLDRFANDPFAPRFDHSPFASEHHAPHQDPRFIPLGYQARALHRPCSHFDTNSKTDPEHLLHHQHSLHHNHHHPLHHRPQHPAQLGYAQRDRREVMHAPGPSSFEMDLQRNFSALPPPPPATEYSPRGRGGHTLENRFAHVEPSFPRDNFAPFLSQHASAYGARRPHGHGQSSNPLPFEQQESRLASTTSSAQQSHSHAQWMAVVAHKNEYPHLQHALGLPKSTAVFSASDPRHGAAQHDGAPRGAQQMKF